MSKLIYLSVILTFVLCLCSCEKENGEIQLPSYNSFVSFDMYGQHWEINSPDTSVFSNNHLGINNEIRWGEIYEDTAELVFHTVFIADTVSPGNIRREAMAFDFYFKLPKDTISAYSSGNKFDTEYLIQLFSSTQFNISEDQNYINNTLRVQWHNSRKNFLLSTLNVDQSASNIHIEHISEITDGPIAGSLIIEGSFDFIFWGTIIEGGTGSTTYDVQNGIYKMVIRNGSEITDINSRDL